MSTLETKEISQPAFRKNSSVVRPGQPEDQELQTLLEQLVRHLARQAAEEFLGDSDGSATILTGTLLTALSCLFHFWLS